MYSAGLYNGKNIILDIFASILSLYKPVVLTIKFEHNV